MPSDSYQIETQTAGTTGFKARRKSASDFFKKALRKEELLKDESIRKLQDENRKLRQQLNDANIRIRELESAAMESAATENQSREREMTSSPEMTSGQSAAEILHSIKSFEHRDDNDSEEEINDDSDAFSVEVAAATMGSTIVHEVLDQQDEVQSFTSSACTIPTGNDKKSNSQRREQELRQKQRQIRGRRSFGEDAYLNYFSRRSPPLDRITEISTQRNLLDDLNSGDDTASTTSDLTLSIASSSLGDDDSTDAVSLMNGRKIPLRAMKSLLRISSVDSDAMSNVHDDDPVLFGEI